jgi:hypothetical protein
MMLKQLKLNTEDDNPSNHRKKYEESTHVWEHGFRFFLVLTPINTGTRKIVI